MRVGVPIALQEATVQFSFLVINMVVNGMGLMPSAGYGVAQKVVSVIMLVPSSIMQSVSAFVAQNIGAGRADRAVKGVLSAIAVGCGLGVFMFGAGFFFGGSLSSFFTSDSGVIAQSAAFLRGFSPECVLTCVLFSVIGYFNGRGNSLPGHGARRDLGAACTYPALFFHGVAAERFAHSHRPRHAYYHRLRNHFLRSVLRVDEARAAQSILHIAEQEKIPGLGPRDFLYVWDFLAKRRTISAFRQSASRPRRGRRYRAFRALLGPGGISPSRLFCRRLF